MARRTRASPEFSARSHPRIRHAGPARGLRDLVGEGLSPDEFRSRFSRRGWRPAFWALARIASMLCNDGGAHGPGARQLADALRAEVAIGRSRIERALSGALDAHAELPVAHEASIYLLQALAILHGSEDDNAIFSDAQLAFLLLAANDYVFEWRERDARELTRAERLLADTCRSMLFNHDRDAAAEFARGALILDPMPRRTRRWSLASEWSALQCEAFGAPAREYVEALAGPLFLISHLWEATDDTCGPRGPVIEPDTWLPLTGLEPSVTRSHFDALTIDRDAARTKLAADVRADGIPIGTTVFHHHPLVRFDDRRLVAASPWVVRSHLRAGLWARMSGAARAGGSALSKDWPPAFGDLVEQWCQRIARTAGESPRFKGTLHIAPSPDDGEIEDIVITQSNRVALISVKGTMVREDILRGARCRSTAVDFFERFFFGLERDDYRSGAARLLDAKIALLRAGEYEPTVSRRTTVYPMIVTFDEFGADNPGGYDYLRARCNSTGVLKGPGVRPLVCVSIAMFENLMGYCAKGISFFDILDQKFTPPWATARFDVFLHAKTGTVRHRLEALEPIYAELTGAMLERFQRSLAASRENGDGSG